jgi:pimeloyl-ACP methyl ester carboxylesterase
MDTATEFRHQQVQLDDSSLHVVEAGDLAAPPVLLLHGWPQSWRTWRDVMTIGSTTARMIAIDLPGVGGSTGDATDGSKRAIAEVVHGLIEAMQLEDLTLIGQDAGGVVAYSYLRTYDDIARVVIVNAAIPGIDPWDELLANPFVWHIAFHGTPQLPEQLVQGRQREYFDYFYDLLAPDPATITDEARAEYAEAYGTAEALTAGFNWYRAFGADARANRRSADHPPRTPLLFLHGEHEFGDLESYVAGLRSANVHDVTGAVIPGAGHFAQEDAPEQLWAAIATFAGLPG